MSDIVFRRIQFSREYIKLSDIFVRHYNDIIGDGRFRLDLSQYLSQEESGHHYMFGAYRGESCLGYASFFIADRHHHNEGKYAFQDAIYILPEHRGFGLKFIKYCEKELKESGVNVIFQYVRPSFDFSNLLTRMGYGVEEVCFSKRLGD